MQLILSARNLTVQLRAHWFWRPAALASAAKAARQCRPPAAGPDARTRLGACRDESQRCRIKPDANRTKRPSRTALMPTDIQAGAHSGVRLEAAVSLTAHYIRARRLH